MIKFCLLLGITVGQFSIVPVLYSQYTSPFMVNYFKSTLDCSDLHNGSCKIQTQFRFKVYEVKDSSDLESIFANSDTIVMYDGCASLGLTTLINEYARKLGFLQLIIGYASENTLPFVFYTDYSYSSYVNAALSIAKTYKIEKAIAIISSEFTEMDFSNKEGIEIVAQLIVSQTATYEYIFWLFSKKLKILGVKLFFLKTNPEISKLIQQAIVEADMNKQDYMYIYMQEAAWGAYLEGSILLEGKWFHSTDIFNYIDNLVYWGCAVLYSLLSENLIHGSYSGYILNSLLAAIFKPEVLGFTIYNVQNGSVTKVGFISGAGIQVSPTVVFPGGTIIPPNSEKIKIPISINGARYYNDEQNVISQVGAIFAINDIKAQGDLLPNFEIVINNMTDCKNDENSTNLDCLLDNMQELGYFHIPRLDTSMTVKTMHAFQENNIATPVIGVQTSTIMSDLEFYPQYSRVSYPNSRTASAAALILSVFGISKCSLLYSDSQWGKDFSDQFINQTDSYGIKILNKNRAIPVGFKGSDKKMIQEIIDYKSRYVVLEIQWPDILYIIEAFYDLGMREGDIYLIVGDGVISVSDLDEKLIGSKSYSKRKEIMSGLIYISFLTFQNQIGFDLKTEILDEYGNLNDYMCLFYDAAYLGLYTIDALMNWGVNVNSSTIEESVREVAFTGCSGVVRVSQEGNDRLTILLGIYNLIQVNSTWTMNLCGLYDPSQLIVLQIKQSLSWNENGDIPSDIIGDDQECPFRDILVQSFLDGYVVLITVETIPVVVAIIFTIIHYDFIFKRKYPKLVTMQKENLLDIISYLIFIIESLQYMQIGPNFKEFFPRWSNATKLTMLDIRGIFKKGLFSFWNQIQLYIALAFGWCILLLWKRSNIGKGSQNLILETINAFNLYILPPLGDILFLPVLLYLFETFQCTSSIGDNFSDSFHNQHCSTFCWQGDHIYYVIFSAIGICLFTPASLYLRFTWKNDLPFHFKEQPLHYAIKTVTQILLIALSTIVQPASENIFLGLAIGVLFGYVIISILKRPLNYDRASLWYIIFLCFSLLLFICCGLAKFNKLCALIVLVLGWAFLVVFGGIYQKLYLPSLLDAEKGQSIYQLFRFQLFSINPEDAGIAKSAKYRFAWNSSQSRSNHPGWSNHDEDILKSNAHFMELTHGCVEHLGEYNSSLCNYTSTQK